MDPRDLLESPAQRVVDSVEATTERIRRARGACREEENTTVPRPDLRTKGEDVHRRTANPACRLTRSPSPLAEQPNPGELASVGEQEGVHSGARLSLT
uniref:Uncharacterized protein n=1 Tax=Arundo donax TaxID=35708 RepID=A0A0A8YUI3_ARUDO